MARARSIVIVAQHAPPSTSVGARRPAALAKALTARGHRVAMLTSLASGSGPVAQAGHTIRTRDLLATPLNWRRGSLDAQQGAGGATYEEASRLEELVVPDLSAISWMPFVLARVGRAVREAAADCVITTGPPQSAHLAGAAVRRRGPAWVADLRDGWTFDPPHPWATPALAEADRALEAAVLRRADAVVAVTEPISRDLRERLGLGAVTITNGFDPDDDVAPDTGGLVSPGRLTVAYTGRLGVAGRRPQALLDAALELGRRRPEHPPEVVFAGPITRAEQPLFTDPRYREVARSVGVLERPRTLALQREADVLVVIAAGDEGHPSPSVATGKLFEYLAARRPVLVLGERTEAARIVTEAGLGEAAPVGDPGAIAAALERLADAPPPGGDAARAYAWPVLAERYESVVEDAVAARGRG